LCTVQADAAEQSEERHMVTTDPYEDGTQEIRRDFGE
jgi:hypothetical protein